MSKQGLVKITKLPKDLKNFKGTICCYNGEWYAPADSEVVREQSDDNLPPVPEGTVVLPKCFEKPYGVVRFEAWGYCPDNPEWEWSDNWGGHPPYRYAVPADSEIARINGVGVPKKEKVPNPRGWAVSVLVRKEDKASHGLSCYFECSMEAAIGMAVNKMFKEKPGWSVAHVHTAKIE